MKASNAPGCCRRVFSHAVQFARRCGSCSSSQARHVRLLHAAVHQTVTLGAGCPAEEKQCQRTHCLNILHENMLVNHVGIQPCMLHTWHAYMAHIHGTHTWHTYMAHIHGTHTWHTYMAHIHGTHTWHTYMARIHGTHTWHKHCTVA